MFHSTVVGRAAAGVRYHVAMPSANVGGSRRAVLVACVNRSHHPMARRVPNSFEQICDGWQAHQVAVLVAVPVRGPLCWLLCGAHHMLPGTRRSEGLIANM